LGFSAQKFHFLGQKVCQNFVSEIKISQKIDLKVKMLVKKFLG